MRISDLISDVCSSDLLDLGPGLVFLEPLVALQDDAVDDRVFGNLDRQRAVVVGNLIILEQLGRGQILERLVERRAIIALADPQPQIGRSEEHTSELQSLMRISYAVLCLKNK